MLNEPKRRSYNKDDAFQGGHKDTLGFHCSLTTLGTDKKSNAHQEKFDITI